MAEASAIVGFVSLAIQAFDGCIKGIVLLSAAQGLGSRADVIQCQLQWENYQLNAWAGAVGIFNDPGELRVPLSSLAIVHSTLTKLNQLLESTTKLRENYGLKLDITEEEYKDVRTPQRFSGILKLDHFKPAFVNDTAKVYSRRNSPWKKLRWAAFDEAQFQVLLRDIRFFNERLNDLLDPVQKATFMGSSNALIRTMVATSPDNDLRAMMSGPLAKADEAITASALLRQKGFLLNLVEPGLKKSSTGSTTWSSETIVVPTTSHEFGRISPARRLKDLRLDSKHLHRFASSGNGSGARELIIFDQRVALMEWKDVPATAEPRLKHRIADVASMLSEMKHSKFHSLHCVGFVKDAQVGRYAYIFDLPSNVTMHIIRPEVYTSSLDITCSMNTLKDLLLFQAQRPSLTQRIKLAITLAETTLQLHTAGWVHKGIRAENVLFFCPAEHDWKIDGGVLPNAWLGGYDFARMSNGAQMTEDPAATREPRLYRHPLSLDSIRPPFSEAFDLYSLGCVLLEIGLWQTLQSILLRRLRNLPQIPEGDTSEVLQPLSGEEYYSICSKKQEFLLETESSNVQCILSRLEFMAGTKYATLVRSCLEAADHGNKGDVDDISDMLEVENKLLAGLEMLSDAL